MSGFTVLADSPAIEKPLTDDRSYRFIKLDNNLKVLLIHDPQADKAAAALDVNVGSFGDHQYNVPGLAHFCEHLLFMGTEKYPVENEYASYLAKHSGRSNAYTALEHTNYYFQVSADYLEGALDRFAQFFISPLFSNSCKDREINAVDSENKKNLQSDMWRFYQLDKGTSNPHHPYNGFSTGNHKTLRDDPLNDGKNVRDILIEFHKNSYSANRMGLTILGKEDLDTLSEWAIEKFSPVPNKDLSRPDYNGEVIYSENELGKLIAAKPVQDTHKLELTFMIPDDFEDTWNYDPSRYYSHLLGHESKGSIYHYIKEKGWVTELSAGLQKTCKGSSSLIFELELTTKGLEHWEEIVVIVFQYLKLVNADEPKEWIWQEVNDISKVNFKFRQKDEAANTVSKLSNKLYKFGDGGFIPSEYILSSTIHHEFNADLIKQFGQYLNPANFRIMYTSKLLEGLDKKEEWYGTEYSYEDFPTTLVNNLKNVQLNPELHYPSPNNFIPENFNVLRKKSETPLKHPYLLEDNNKLQLWFKQDDRFEVPKGNIELLFHLPPSKEDIRSSAYSRLLSELVTDHLNEITYYASIVGLNVRISFLRDGFNIRVSGYNDKLTVLLEQVLSKFVHFKPDKERFETLKLKVIQDYQNFGYVNPFQQIGTHFLVLTNEGIFSSEDKAKFLSKDADFNDFFDFVTKGIWADGVFVEALVHGNFDIGNAIEVKDLLSKYTKEWDAVEDSVEKIYQKVRLQNYAASSNTLLRFELANPDPKNINSCIEYIIQISPNSQDDKLRVLTDLFSTICKQPSFDQLRTKEQLGYVVFSGTRLGRTSLYFRVLVQSERSTEYLEYRIEEFLSKFRSYLIEKMTEEEFESFKESLRDSKLTKLRFLSEETARFWNEISSGYLDFQEKDRHVDILNNISKDEFLAFVSNFIFNESKQTSKILVHLKAQSVPEVSRTKLIQSSLSNYLTLRDLEISSDIVDEIVSKNEENIELIADDIVTELEKNEENSIDKDLKIDLVKTLKHNLETPVPEKYPIGKLVTIEDFRKEFKKGGPPTPIASRKEFYYPDDHSRL
ncbi:uncharacterized protein CANTADRAFT_7816 [Suhomyces tanzawaensis NRRL Y-17324]|uniref:Uncharacterized protein n=1 Tax=Suhomyces tanzawaensis NRRL Y-17324 TaxID=984487 RepID=A0A1E4SCT8_9ASCO|nr:uncharacterized protein CANTADRAFT_7816 [Suhomyces tanzawaensis NRRL Y-17324]ODV77337.1 hypothetical protein CANTADRAFT_7816 [Suhomyces tanzawaensis NRRL Y-17324]